MDERTLHSMPRTDAARIDSKLHALTETGHHLAAEDSPGGVLLAALEAGLRTSGAERGAFYKVAEESVTDLYGLLPSYLLAGEDKDLPVPHPASVFGAPLALQGVTRVDDLLVDPQVSRSFITGSIPDMPFRSYLAVPLLRRGEACVTKFGVLVYAHTKPAAFSEEAALSLSALAVQAALALENVLLRQTLQRSAATAREANHRLRQALDAAELGTWSWTAATGLVDFDVRGAELFGVPPNIPLPRNALRERLLNPEDLHRAPADLRALLEGSGGYTAEYRVRQPDGSDRWVASTGSAVKDTDGRRVGMIGTLQDISLRKAQEHSLRTSEKLAATGRLAAAIAHEINNPLEAVTNLIYLAKTDPLTPSPVRRMLETADTELARVSQIAQQTLGFYRDTTRPVSVDLNDLLRAVVDLFDRKLSGKRLRCTLDLEPGLSVVGLQGEIRQVVSNLLVNAIDACAADGGKIHIRGRHRRRDGDRGVSVLVSDEGSGIPHHVRPRLFTPFTTTKQSLGTGLGLWVTQGMVEKHGGSVRFRSRVDDPTGTVFRVYLPAMGSPQLFAHQSSPILQ